MHVIILACAERVVREVTARCCHQAPAAWMLRASTLPSSNVIHTWMDVLPCLHYVKDCTKAAPDLVFCCLADEIYTPDIVFRDPRNCFKGMQNYQLIFWSLRFHGRIFFSKLYVEVKRIWQPEDSVIKMRWTVHGIPR